MSKLIIIQTVIPDYRVKFFTYLKIKLEDNFILFGGERFFKETITTDKTISFHRGVKNIFFFNRNFLFQTGPFWKYVLKPNTTFVISLNPRNISNWLILILRKILNRKTIVWGHAWPRSGPNSKSDLLRHFMRLLANEIIVYTKTQEEELSLKMPSKPIYTASNALIFKKEMVASTQDLNDKNNILYVGRLTKGKKPLFLINAFLTLHSSLPKNSQLIIIGDGEEKKALENYIIKNNIAHKVKLLGHISNYSELKTQYDNALFSVSPGYVGLSVTQSFGFGVPMLVSENENHSPEIEAVHPNENALYFKTDDIEDFKNKSLLFFENKDFWINKRSVICNFCQNKYSIEAMAEPFLMNLD